MTYTRKNQGVCSLATTVEIDNGIIQNVYVESGCDGNLKGVCELLKGQTTQQAVERLQGIRCGFKATSCPDQIALCIAEATAQGK